MLIVIEFIANTNYEIQIWITKTCCKLYAHKMKEHIILKTLKVWNFKMLNFEKKT
jgi:hypothetical protein